MEPKRNIVSCFFPRIKAQIVQHMFDILGTVVIEPRDAISDTCRKGLKLARLSFATSIGKQNSVFHFSPGWNSGVQVRAVFGLASVSIWRICPMHAHLLFLMSLSICGIRVVFSRSLFEITFGQQICSILRHLLSKPLYIEKSAPVILQLSEPYNRTALICFGKFWFRSFN